MNVLFLWIALSTPPTQFHPPFRVTAEGGYIDVDYQRAAPVFEDIDQDGVRELLVGQFGSGRIRVYKNVGTEEAPAFQGFQWLQAGDQVASVPFG